MVPLAWPSCTRLGWECPKDNFQFGVRAVDKDGHHSPVAFPITTF
jgi:hypothetical protein